MHSLQEKCILNSEKIGHTSNVIFLMIWLQRRHVWKLLLKHTSKIGGGMGRSLLYHIHSATKRKKQLIILTKAAQRTHAEDNNAIAAKRMS